jgi:hypothetical protein
MKYYPYFVSRRKDFVTRKGVKLSGIHHGCRLEQVTTPTPTPAVCPVSARLTFHTNCVLAPARADIFCLLSCNTRREEGRNISGNTEEGIKVALLKQTLAT